MSDSTHERPGLFRRLWRGSDKVKTVRYALHAYGKLPIYKDFISTGLTDPGSREFRNWLDRGFSHRWAVDEDYRHTEIPSHSFLFRLPDGKGCVAGSLWGSSDQGGLRKFPFTLFLSFPSGQPAADPLTAAEYLSLLERRCQDLRDRFGPGGSLASLYQSYRGAEFECPLKSRELILKEAKSAASQVPLSDFAESILGASSASRWPMFLAAITEAHARTDGVGAIRLPLGGTLPRARELEFWLLWMARLDAKKKRPLCGLLYPNGSGPGRVVLFFRDLRAEDILLLHPARADYPDVLELPRPTAPESRAEPAAPPVAVSLDPVGGSPAPALAETGEATLVSDSPAQGAATLEPPTGVTPEPQVVVTPEPPVAVTPEPQVVVTPEPPVAVTPEPQVVVTSEPPAAVTPESHAPSTPQPPEVATPESQTLATPEPVVAAAADEPIAITDAEAASQSSDSVEPIAIEPSTPAPSEPVPPLETVTELLTDAAPFPEAETIPPSWPSGAAPEAPLLDSSGRVRETQPPFEAGPGRLTAAAVGLPATTSLGAEPPAPAPKETSFEAPPSGGQEEAPSEPVVEALALPAAVGVDDAAPSSAVAAPGVTVEPAAPESPDTPLPPGWDRPLFTLLEG